MPRRSSTKEQRPASKAELRRVRGLLDRTIRKGDEMDRMLNVVIGEWQKARELAVTMRSQIVAAEKQLARAQRRHVVNKRK
jgi:hypothetical protein